jgi:hypothetical protein
MVRPSAEPATLSATPRQFCSHYKRWRSQQKRSMRQVHRTGEKLFVAVFGASNYTYAEATESQRSADFIASHVRANSRTWGVWLSYSFPISSRAV